jgi:hypothetical protein
MHLIQADYMKLVTLTVPGVPAPGNTGTQFTWNDQQQLRYARVLWIEAVFAETLTHAQPQTVPIIPGNLASKVSVIFRTNDPDDIEKKKGDNGRFSGTLDTIEYLPLALLNPVQSFGGSPAPFVRYVPYWRDRYIVWQESHVQISPGGLGNTTDVAICLAVYYTFLNDKGKIIEPRN